MTWRIRLTATVRSQLLAIKDRRTRAKLAKRIDTLSQEPKKQGKPLIGELKGVYSVRAAGQRYRILYRVEDEAVVVLVVALGLRRAGDKKDIYALARRLLKVGLLQEPQETYGSP